MPVTPQWLPSEDSFERQLLERLVAEGRAFIKVLRYNQHRDQCLASAMLTDTGDAGPLLFVVPPWLEGPALAEDIRGANPGGNSPVWVWQPASQAMPRLPEAAITGQRIERPTVARPPTHLETDIETT